MPDPARVRATRPTHLSLQDFQRCLSAALDLAEHTGHRLQVTRHGRASGVLVSPADLDRLQILDRYPDLLARVEAAAQGEARAARLAEITGER
jgi:prevent-host-death family protein